MTRCVNFRKKTSCMNMSYNCPTTLYRSILAQMYKFLVEKKIFIILAYELSMSYCKNVNKNQKYIYLGQNTSIYCSQIIVVNVHANGFL